jgi:hypothetical protein
MPVLMSSCLSDPCLGIEASVELGVALAVSCTFAHWRMMQVLEVEGPFGVNLLRANHGSKVLRLRNLRVKNAPIGVLLLGMRAGGRGDPRAEASPFQVSPSEPSIF